jgi:hypothetical protein
MESSMFQLHGCIPPRQAKFIEFGHKLFLKVLFNSYRLQVGADFELLSQVAYAILVRLMIFLWIFMFGLFSELSLHVIKLCAKFLKEGIMGFHHQANLVVIVFAAIVNGFGLRILLHYFIQTY